MSTVTKSINKATGYYKKIKIHIGSDNLHQRLSSDLNNDEFIQSIKGEKVKFTNVTKNKLATEAGSFQSINSNLGTNQGKYCLPSNFKQTKMDVKSNLNFFHLNTSSLSFPRINTPF